MKKAVNYLLRTPKRDPGSEAGLGFDFQWHLASRLCIEMLMDPTIERLICELGEDVVIVRKGGQIELIQVKKRDSGTWTINTLIAPAKKEKTGVLGKLFLPLQEGKNITSLRIKGCGRVSSEDDDCSLPNLISILKVPIADRDSHWEAALNPFIDHLSAQLASQGIARSTVEQALHMLDIDFNLPWPDSIETRNMAILGSAVKVRWEVDLTLEQCQQIYSLIFAAIKKRATSPNKPWIDKSISREEMTQLVEKAMPYPYATANQQHSLTLQDKLSRAGLGSKHQYALEARTFAIGLRFETAMTARDWDDLKTEVHTTWQSYQSEHPGASGLDLWTALKDMLSRLGLGWVTRFKDSRFGDRFAEGVFFDMAGICTADFKRGH